MKAKLLHKDNDVRVFAVVFAEGDNVEQNLLRFAESNRFADAQVSAIGAFSEVTLGYFDPQQTDYREIPIREQVEVLSFLGNIVLQNGMPRLHAHVIVGKSDGTAHGGHFLSGKVWPTLEMTVTELPNYLRRTYDNETGLMLINLAA